jgi:pimeloyl-ACP methyl ester carboxylesterase
VTSRSRFVVANRLRHHLVEWGEGGPQLLLLHGFLEHAHAWDLVAPRLAAAGHHVFALDWRGHGDSEWVGSGGYYHFADYSADLAFVIRALGDRVALVGHSMGATSAMSYAGLEPERVSGLVLVDALGPPDMEDEAVPERYESWIRDLERLDERDRRTFTLDEAAARLAERFPRFSPAVARHMAEYGSRPAAGGRAWKFDPLHQTRGPIPFSRARARRFWSRVACPVLYIEGGDSPLHLLPDDKADRLAVLRARRVTMDGVAHHPHLEQPEPFTRLVLDFLGGLPCADS